MWKLQFGKRGSAVDYDPYVVYTYNKQQTTKKKDDEKEKTGGFIRCFK